MKIVTDEKQGQFADHAKAQNVGSAMAVRLLWGGIILAAIKGLSMLF